MIKLSVSHLLKLDMVRKTKMDGYYHSDENKIGILEFIEEKIDQLYRWKMLSFIGIYGCCCFFFIGIISIIIIFVIILFFLIILYSRLSQKIRKLDFLWECINYYY